MAVVVVMIDGLAKVKVRWDKIVVVRYSFGYRYGPGIGVRWWKQGIALLMIVTVNGFARVRAMVRGVAKYA